MAELQPPEGYLNGGGAPAIAPTENVVAKRQRRPSVRLGDIGDQAYDSHRRTKQWKIPAKDSGRGSKARALLNSEAVDGDDREGNSDAVAIASWTARESKSKRGSTKRVRANWASKVYEGEEKFSGGEDVDDGLRDFDGEDSESPYKEQSPFQSLDNENRGHERGANGKIWDNYERNGVKIWLNQLGLGRYAPVFEIHEVDDEVLPLLTLEDLKDMGINAVGSRRKMYCAIQKLSKGFS
ncbi:hypothetical protein NMG60_11004679 [Bertholletia excelsa]